MDKWYGVKDIVIRHLREWWADQSDEVIDQAVPTEIALNFYHDEVNGLDATKLHGVDSKLAWQGKPAAPVGLCVSCGRAVEVTSVGEPGICVDCSH